MFWRQGAFYISRWICPESSRWSSRWSCWSRRCIILFPIFVTVVAPVYRAKKPSAEWRPDDAFPDGHSVFIPRCGGHKKAPANRQRPVSGREPRRCRLTRRARRAQGDWRTPSGAYLRHSHWLSSWRGIRIISYPPRRVLTIFAIVTISELTQPSRNHRQPLKGQCFSHA